MGASARHGVLKVVGEDGYFGALALDTESAAPSSSSEEEGEDGYFGALNLETLSGDNDHEKSILVEGRLLTLSGDNAGDNDDEKSILVDQGSSPVQSSEGDDEALLNNYFDAMGLATAGKGAEVEELPVGAFSRSVETARARAQGPGAELPVGAFSRSVETARARAQGPGAELPVGAFSRSVETARARAQEPQQQEEPQQEERRGERREERQRGGDDDSGPTGEPGEDIQVFVRGIPFRARPLDVVELFEGGGSPSARPPLDVVELFEENCGVVTRVEGMFHAGRASGRAWVTFEDPIAATKALGFDRQEMDGRFIEVYPPWSRPARQALRQVTEGQGGGTEDREPRRDDRGSDRFEPRGGARGRGMERGGFREGGDRGRGDRGGARGDRGGRDLYAASGYGAASRSRDEERGPNPPSKSVFIGRVPRTAGQMDFEDALAPYAGIDSIRLGMKDGEFQGYAHVDFVSEEAASAADAGNFEIAGKEVAGNFEIAGKEVRVDYAGERPQGGVGPAAVRP
ncbi:hypothetical protein T484DRAFT_1794768 [Baffinella frigidus]|nr:hypothetical protein T484DRAFT_1794768 [Cryptophyta sp. CCMP2293]